MPADDLTSNLKALREAHRRELMELEARAAAERSALVRTYESSLSWRLSAPVRLLGARPGLKRLLRGVLRRGRGAVPAEDAQARGGSAKEVWRGMAASALRAFLSSGSTLRLPRSDAPEVSVILVLYNQAELTFACLQSLAASLAGGPPAEVVILDNLSFDATPRLLAALSGATVIRAEDNLHFLRGVNRAVEAARGRHLLLLNNDAVLLPGALDAALAALGREERVGAVGARIILPDGRLQEAGSYIASDGHPQGYLRGADPEAGEAMFPREVDYCSGAFLLTPRDVWDRLGGFDERYAPAYFEETDYCLRLREHGLRVLYEPDAAIIHYEFGSSASSADAIALQERNGATFRARNAAYLATRPPPGSGAAVAARTAGPRRPRVLMIEDRVPHHRLGSGFPRSNDLLRAVAGTGAEVTLFPTLDDAESWTDIRASVPREVEVLAGRGLAALPALLADRRGHYDAVLACRPHNMRALRDAWEADPAARGDARLVYDAEALFAAREVLQDRLAGLAVSEAEAASRIAAEASLAAGVSAVLAVSEAEAARFREAGAADVRVLGFAMPADPTPAAFPARSGFVFIGMVAADDTPNADSLRWFASEVLPRIRRALGQAVRLTVVGRVTAPSILALRDDALDLLGVVPDPRPVFDRVRVMVAPTRFAAGIPHKVYQAAAWGVPAVATPLIADQTGWGADALPWAEDADGFAAACIRLHEDGEHWEAVRAAALARVGAECSPEAFRRTVEDVIRAATATVSAQAVPAPG